MRSLGGPQPYVPVGLDEDKDTDFSDKPSSVHQKRARVLCSYDAKDATELNLTGNEVDFLNRYDNGLSIQFNLIFLNLGNFCCGMQSTEWRLYVWETRFTQRFSASSILRNS